MIKIEIEKKTRKVKIDNILIGNDGENLQDTLQFCFKDEFVDGQARLELKFQNGETTFVVLDKIEQTYTTLLSNVMTKRGKVFAQLVITENGINDKIPVFKSDMFYFICNQSINAEEEAPEGYDDWITRGDALFLKVQGQGNYAEEQGNYAKAQGDYAKEQKIELVKTNEEANKIITNFETNVSEYTTSFNENVDNKTSDFDSNVESKTSEFNVNSDNKINSYNTNASEKLNTYNTNSNNKIKEYNDNASNKTTYYNNNATTKLNEYNTNASIKLQEYNDNATQKIEEYDAHSESLDNKIVSTRNELERVKNDILETGTDTDTFVHLEDSAMAEYQELSVDGVCEQETTSGKNLFNKNNTHSDIGVSVTSLNTGIRVTLTQASNYRNTAFVLGGSELLGKTITQKTIITPSASNSGTVHVYLGSQENTAIERIIGTSAGTNTRQFPIPNSFPEGCDRVWVLFYGNVTGTANIGDYIDYTDLMLVEGSYTSDNFPTYEPYTGGQPSPSPDYPQEIKTIENSLNITSCNKNLFDINNVNNLHNVFINSKSILTTDPENETIYIKCKQNTTYTISKIADNVFRAGTTQEIPIVNMKVENYTDNSSGNKITLTSSPNANYLVLFIRNRESKESMTTILNSIQIEEGATATPFEQHLETQITANLPEGEFIGKINDTYKDTLKVEYNETDGQYHLNLYKNVGRAIATENSKYSALNLNSNGLGVVGLFNLDRKPKTGMNYGISSHLEYIWYYNSSRPCFYNNGDNNSIMIITKNTTKQDFLNYIKDNNITFYYALETPYTLDLGIVDMPITYNEITNLFTDSDLMPQINAKYYRTFEKTIQNLQVNEKALKQELIDINNRLSALETAQTSVTSESEVVE